jgi:hypothetical protein
MENALKNATQYGTAAGTYTIAYGELLFACIPDGTDLEAELRAEEQKARIEIDRDALKVVSGLTLTNDPELAGNDWEFHSDMSVGSLGDTAGRSYEYAVLYRELPRVEFDEVDPGLRNVSFVFATGECLLTHEIDGELVLDLEWDYGYTDPLDSDESWGLSDRYEVLKPLCMAAWENAA